MIFHDALHVAKFRRGTHHGLLLLRLPALGALGLRSRVEELFRTEDVESWAGCLVVLSAHKLRVLRPDA